jgi:SAM-dependent methyltransferase
MITKIEITEQKLFPSILEIINNSGECNGNKVFKKLSQKKGINILDLGSRFPSYLIIAYHELDTKLLRAIDKCYDEQACIENLLNSELNQIEFEIFNKINNFYEAYTICINPDENSFRKNKMSEAEFRKVILDNYSFNTKIENYLHESIEKFDLIICSNVLHFTNQSDNLISKIKNLLTEDGIIYIKIQITNEKNNINFNRPYSKNKFIEEINSVFDSGFLYELNDDPKWHKIAFINDEL